MLENLFTAALACIECSDLENKISLTNNYKLLWDQHSLDLKPLESGAKKIQSPGLPDNLTLVQPKNLARRRLGSLQGKAALIHAICHIEFNAINLAWDAIYRFQNMPYDYYNDWIRVAFEEAKHFNLLNTYLKELGFSYGDFPAHNGLWELAVITDYDVIVRMALVPRIMEARGLDVTPTIIEKFQLIHDDKAVAILNIILTEEQGHVAIGNKWFHYLCDNRGVDPIQTFKELINMHASRQIKRPFNTNYRLASGFTQAELDLLESLVLS